MKTIHKFKVYPNIRATLMNRGAKILNVQTQGDEIYVWALVDTREGSIYRDISYCGTGWEIDDSMNPETYIGTAQLNGLVLHFFDLGES
jgi:hypothetical protein